MLKALFRGLAGTAFGTAFAILIIVGGVLIGVLVFLCALAAPFSETWKWANLNDASEL